MIRICSTKGLTEEEWLEYRRTGIGGSDSSIILGINKYRSLLELWEDKTGISAKVSGENNYTYFGHVMESVIRDEFKRRTGLSVRQKHYILRSESHPYMIANLDGVVKEPDGSYAVFEAKTASEYKRAVWEKKVPDEYYCQVQHYMAVTGYSRAYVAAIVGGNSYYCHVVERDEEYIENLVKKEADFWKCVEEGKMPEADESEATAEYLNNRYGCSKTSEIELPASAEDLIHEYISADEQIKTLNSRKTGLANKLKAMMQDNEIGRAGDNKVIWSTVSRQNLDKDKLKNDLGSAYDKYVSETSYRRFSVA